MRSVSVEQSDTASITNISDSAPVDAELCGNLEFDVVRLRARPTSLVDVTKFA